MPLLRSISSGLCPYSCFGCTIKLHKNSNKTSEQVKIVKRQWKNDAFGYPTLIKLHGRQLKEGSPMSETFRWSRETYERSISSHCWDFTPYDDGWSPSLDADEGLSEVVRMEYELG